MNLIARIENLESSNRIWVLLENVGVAKKLKLENRLNIDYNKV